MKDINADRSRYGGFRIGDKVVINSLSNIGATVDVHIVCDYGFTTEQYVYVTFSDSSICSHIDDLILVEKVEDAEITGTIPEDLVPLVRQMLRTVYEIGYTDSSNETYNSECAYSYAQYKNVTGSETAIAQVIAKYTK